jgi:hypothetical protein
MNLSDNDKWNRVKKMYTEFTQRDMIYAIVIVLVSIFIYFVLIPAGIGMRVLKRAKHNRINSALARARDREHKKLLQIAGYYDYDMLPNT